ncbi:MAG: hypothetical protein M1829_006953 [Trizodia sp. TS-e1964]|nr:MAG: hypothetical protein M1829_006953 [Trizodia sp. TS-e1964]
MAPLPPSPATTTPPPLSTFLRYLVVGIDDPAAALPPALRPLFSPLLLHRLLLFSSHPWLPLLSRTPSTLDRWLCLHNGHGAPDPSASYRRADAETLLARVRTPRAGVGVVYEWSATQWLVQEIYLLEDRADDARDARWWGPTVEEAERLFAAASASEVEEEEEGDEGAYWRLYSQGAESPVDAARPPAAAVSDAAYLARYDGVQPALESGESGAAGGENEARLGVLGHVGSSVRSLMALANAAGVDVQDAIGVVMDELRAAELAYMS